MHNRTTPIDWVEDVCHLIYFMAASYGDKIYTVGGRVTTRYTNKEVSDSYLRILDFSKPINSSKNSIDISTDNITTAIRLPDNIPRLEGGVLFISDGVMHMLPGRNGLPEIADANGNVLNATTYRPNLVNKAWDFDLESKEWSVYDSGIEDQAQYAVVAIDAEKQSGWYYGGVIMPDTYYNGTELVDFIPNGSPRALQNLYHLDRGNSTPIKVEADSSFVGNVNEGELVYIGGAGEAGILVLIGGLAGPSSGDAPWREIQTIHVFDIATKAWFAQPTTAQAERYPTSLTSFCSVVASAGDNSSHNIYIYGGSNSDQALNEVFILTLPAFHWVLVYPSANDALDIDTRQTYAHRCEKVHEKHMVAYRGYTINNRCDYDKGLNKFQGMAIYDMSSLKWTTKVELENSKYLVPEKLYEIIGGNATGDASFIKPRQGFLDPKLNQVFVNKAALPTGDYSQNRLPGGAIAGAIAGAVIGGFVLVLVIVAFFLMRRPQRMVALPPPTPVKPQELEECELHELPSTPAELDASAPKKRQSELNC